MPDIFKKQLGPKSELPTQNPLINEQEAIIPNTQTAQNNESKKSISIFTTFLKNPGGISFAEQDPDEKIVLFLRRDFGTNLPWITSTIVLLLVPLLLRFIFQTTNITVSFFPPNFVRLFTVFYYFVVTGFAFSNFLTWFFTVGLVTTKRAVDIDFVNVSSINFAAADLTDIIDAKYSQNGFSQSFFDYGNVDLIIQTPQEKLSFDKCPRPSEVSNIIDDLIGHKKND